MSSLRRRLCSPAAAPPLDDDDLLSEILLRLSPLPSSLPRACAVCKRWRLLVSDPRFLRRFRIHHRRNPPLLGCLDSSTFGNIYFVSTMKRPNIVPPFFFQFDLDNRFRSLGCRHGLVLISDRTQNQFVVWDPVTGDNHQLAIPPGFDLRTTEASGAVLLAAEGVHFQVVFVAIGSDGTRAIACVYSSETGGWGNLVSTLIPSGARVSKVPAVLVGDSLYWNFTSCSPSILEFDFEKQTLAVIRVPVDMSEDYFTVMRADGGGLGFLFVSSFTAQLWKRKTDCDGVASWALARIIELDKLLSLNSDKGLGIIGFAEENNVVFFWTTIGKIKVQLQSLQFRILPITSFESHYHPFESVYTAGIGGEHDGAEHLLL